jgi:hypothetical protein
MASGLILDYLGVGLLSARPATPSLHTGALGVWFSTDTGQASYWDGSEWYGSRFERQLAASDLTTNLTTGTSKAYFRTPCAFTLTEVRASLIEASSSGLVTVDINKNGTTMLSTELTIDATEKTSETATTPAVISVSSVADDDEITIDIDAAGTDAKGLIVTLVGVAA